MKGSKLDELDEILKKCKLQISSNFALPITNKYYTNEKGVINLNEFNIRKYLDDIAKKYHYNLSKGSGIGNINKIANKILNDYIKGRYIHYELPPNEVDYINTSAIKNNTIKNKTDHSVFENCLFSSSLFSNTLSNNKVIVDKTTNDIKEESLENEEEEEVDVDLFDLKFVKEFEEHNHMNNKSDNKTNMKGGFTIESNNDQTRWEKRKFLVNKKFHNVKLQ